ncbi:MAG: twin-arginine translocation signal domain-containing protein [Burkholderiaceae bacterium]|nr:twin-arginine translocation signal domain-containing protein [Burkholderiaceae bacterium]
MNIKRRDFFKGCAAAACVLALPGIAIAAKSANNAPALGAVEKSIKASFGGGFSVESHSQSGKLTHATIENFGNRYAVTSTDLLDWKIVAPSK